MEKLIEPVELCVHGTYTKFIKSIKETGLNKMANNIEFYRSANEVILTLGVNGILEPKYFKDIIYK